MAAMNSIIDRVYYDVIKHPHEYPVDWIEREGLPYWKMEVVKHPYAQKMVDLYEKIITHKIKGENKWQMLLIQGSYRDYIQQRLYGN